MVTSPPEPVCLICNKVLQIHGEFSHPQIRYEPIFRYIVLSMDHRVFLLSFGYGSRSDATVTPWSDNHLPVPRTEHKINCSFLAIA